jgi:hypothetical protein
MPRATSLAAYRAIQENGLLSKRRFEVYDAIVHHGPITQGETWKEHFLNKQRHDIGPRFAELERRGVIRIVGTRPCRVTGRSAYIYEATDALPIDPPKEETEDCPHCHGKGRVKVTPKEAATLVHYSERNGQYDMFGGVL